MVFLTILFPTSGFYPEADARLRKVAGAAHVHPESSKAVDSAEPDARSRLRQFTEDYAALKSSTGEVLDSLWPGLDIPAEAHDLTGLLRCVPKGMEDRLEMGARACSTETLVLLKSWYPQIDVKMVVEKGYRAGVDKEKLREEVNAYAADFVGTTDLDDLVPEKPQPDAGAAENPAP